MKIIITSNHLALKYDFYKYTSLLGRTEKLFLSIVCPLAEHMANLHHYVAVIFTHRSNTVRPQSRMHLSTCFPANADTKNVTLNIKPCESLSFCFFNCN